MTKKQRNYTCIVCPMGCEIEVREDAAGTIHIEGNTCARGKKYAEQEHTHPVRTFTTTVAVEDGELCLVPVHSTGEIPKETVRACIKELAHMTATAPLACGDIVCKNVGGTGVDVVASRAVAKKK